MPEYAHHQQSMRWEYENGFYLTSSVDRLGKMLSQYELYKRITHLPGEVLELGVYKGASLARLLTFRAILEAESSRKVLAFDAFGSFPRSGVEDETDRAFIARFETEGGEGYPQDEIAEYLEGKGFGNFELIAGDIRETLPQVLTELPQLRVAMLHLDMDVYEPTQRSLELLESRLVPGALIVVDDYGTVSGATLAIDELCERHQVSLQKLPLSHVPSFIVWRGGRSNIRGAGARVESRT